MESFNIRLLLTTDRGRLRLQQGRPRHRHPWWARTHHGRRRVSMVQGMPTRERAPSTSSWRPAPGTRPACRRETWRLTF